MDPARVYSFSRSKNTSTNWSSSTTASLVSCGVEVTNNSFDMLSPVILHRHQHRRDLGGICSSKRRTYALAGGVPDEVRLINLPLKLVHLYCYRSAWCGRTLSSHCGSELGPLPTSGMSFFCKSFRPGTALCRRSALFYLRKGERSIFFGPASSRLPWHLVHKPAHTDVHNNSQRQEHEQN